MDLFKKYSDIKTYQDMIDKGVIPKTSSQAMSLLTLLKLQADRDRILASLNDEMLGKWNPLFEKKEIKLSDLRGEELTSVIKPEMKVRGIGTYEGRNLEGILGTIKHFSRGTIGVEWETPIEKGHHLNGTLSMDSVQGLYVDINTIELVLDESEDKVVRNEFTLSPNVVADDKNGDLIKFGADYEGVPKGTVGIVTNYDPKKKKLHFFVEEKGDGKKKGKDLVISIDNPLFGLFSDLIKVSSLGQMEPVDKEKEVRRQTLTSLLGSTILEDEIAEKVAWGLLMGKDVCYYGRGGSGKTQASNDTIALAKKQGVLFVVEGSEVQTHPASLHDPHFSKEVICDPKILKKFHPDYISTGQLRKINPKDIPVVVVKYDEGRGIERVQGSIAVRYADLIGEKLPQFGENVDMTNMSDPEGFQPGPVPRSNNGLLFIDEGDKLQIPVQDDMLAPLEEERIMPKKQRFKYPAHSLVVVTANNIDKFSPPFNDRVSFVEIDYPKDADIAYRIVRAAVHKETIPIENVNLPDINIMAPLNFKEQIPMPEPVERAISRFYTVFNEDYTGKGKNEISGSVRSLKDAHLAARAKLTLESLFYENTPSIAGSSEAMQGIAYALETRVNDADRKTRLEAKVELGNYIADKFPALQLEEEKTWWCRAYKEGARIVDKQIPGTHANFIREMKEYSLDPANAIKGYKEIKLAITNPTDNTLKKAFTEFPFIAHLYSTQPRFEKANEKQVIELISYYMKSRQNFDCLNGEEAL